MSDFDELMKKDNTSQGYNWCPNCNSLYEVGTEHKCAYQPISAKHGTAMPNGYTCPICQEWVNYGQSHICGGSHEHEYKFIPQVSPWVEKKLDRIIQLLEELVLDKTGELPDASDK